MIGLNKDGTTFYIRSGTALSRSLSLSLSLSHFLQSPYNELNCSFTSDRTYCWQPISITTLAKIHKLVYAYVVQKYNIEFQDGRTSFNTDMGNKFETLQSHFEPIGDFCNCYQDTTDCSVQTGIPHPCDVCELAFKLSITDGSLVLCSNISLPKKCNLRINIHQRWSRIGNISQNHIAITRNSCHLNARGFSYYLHLNLFTTI